MALASDARSKSGSGTDNIRKIELEKAWTSEHEVVTHSLAEPLVVDTSKLHKSTVCQDKGVCVCNKPEALLFNKNLVLCLKHFSPAPKKKDSSNSVPSPEAVKRQQLQQGFFVLRLVSGQVCELEPCELWLHLGYINYSSWDFGCLQLHRVTDQFVPHDEVRLTAFSDNPNAEDELYLIYV